MLTSVDGICAPYKEERLDNGDLDSGLFCQKINGPGLTYEIVIGLYTGWLCSVKGPYKSGDWPDLKIAKEEGLVRALRKCAETCIADGTDHNPVFINAKRGQPRQLSALISVAKSRHESLNSRFKNFGIFLPLRGFRHDIDTHAIYFHAIANLIQIEIEIESPLFDIRFELDAFDRFYGRYCRQYYRRQYRNRSRHARQVQGH